MKNQQLTLLYTQYQKHISTNPTSSVQQFLSALPFSNSFSRFVKTLTTNDIISVISEQEIPNKTTPSERHFFLELLIFYDQNLIISAFSKKEYSFLNTAKELAKTRNVELSKTEEHMLHPCSLTTILILHNETQILIDNGYFNILFKTQQQTESEEAYFSEYAHQFFSFLQLAYKISSKETVKALLHTYFRKVNMLNKIQYPSHPIALSSELISLTFNHYLSFLQKEQSQEKHNATNNSFLTEERKAKLLRLSEILAQGASHELPALVEGLILFPTVENMSKNLLPEINSPSPHFLMFTSAFLWSTLILAPLGIVTSQLAKHLDFKNLVTFFNNAENEDVQTLISILPKRFTWLLINIINNTLLSSERKDTLLSILRSNTSYALLDIVSEVATHVFEHLENNDILLSEKSTTGTMELLSWVLLYIDETDEPKCLYSLSEIARRRNERIAGTNRDYKRDPTKATNILYKKIEDILYTKMSDFTEKKSDGVELKTLNNPTTPSANENDLWVALHRNIFGKLDNCTLKGETRSNYLNLYKIPECDEYRYFIKKWFLPYILTKLNINDLESLDTFSSSLRLPRANGSKFSFNDNSWSLSSTSRKMRNDFRELVNKCAKEDITPYLSWLEARNKSDNLSSNEKKLFEQITAARKEALLAASLAGTAREEESSIQMAFSAMMM